MPRKSKAAIARSNAAKAGWITRRKAAIARSNASKAGWITRRKAAIARSNAAKAGWVTRRQRYGPSGQKKDRIQADFFDDVDDYVDVVGISDNYTGEE